MQRSGDPAAVVIGAHVNGLGVARSLARLRVDVACITTRPFDIAQMSCAVSETRALPDAHADPGALIDLLREQARVWRGRALFPTSDDAVECLARHHDELAQSYVLTVEPWERTRDVVEKDRMHHLAERAGLDVPRCYGLIDDVLGSPLRFPVVVKPIRHDRLIDHRGRKAYLVHDEAQLIAAARDLGELQSPALVFEWLAGNDQDLFIHCLYMDGRGEPSAGVTVQKIRQSPPWVGSARVARLVEEPVGIRDASIALLRAARVRGPAYVEFKRDPNTGSLRFVEVNCRSALYGSLPAASGIDLVRLCWDDFVRAEPVRAVDTGWRGHWIQLQADVGCSILYGRRESLSLRSFLAPYAGPHVYAVWSASDPAPFAHQSRLALHRLARAPFATRSEAEAP